LSDADSRRLSRVDVWIERAAWSRTPRGSCGARDHAALSVQTAQARPAPTGPAATRPLWSLWSLC